MTALTVFGQAVSLWLMWRYRSHIQAGAEDPATLTEGADPSSALSP